MLHIPSTTSGIWNQSVYWIASASFAALITINVCSMFCTSLENYQTSAHKVLSSDLRALAQTHIPVHASYYITLLIMQIFFLFQLKVNVLYNCITYVITALLVYHLALLLFVVLLMCCYYPSACFNPFSFDD